MLAAVEAGASIRRGFAAGGQEPALLPAEIIWRWCFAAAAWVAGVALVLGYVDSVQVSWQERLAVESGEPLLALAGVAHALRGSAGRLAGGIVATGTALAVLWMLTAAFGRLATLKALLPSAAGGYRPLLGLSFLRAGLFLAGVLAAIGAIILAASAGSAASGGIVAAVLMACIWLAWALLNWLLSLAAIFAVRDRRDTFGAVGEALDLVRNFFGEVVLTSLPFVLLHYAALAAAVAAGIVIFDVMMRVSAQAGWALPAVAIAYFAYVDFLYIARLATYVALAGPD